MINYYLLTKPKIVMGNLMTLIAGFLLASKGHIDPGLFAATLIGLTLIMASSCVFNNYINRKSDAKMERTKHRALVTGLISERNAIIFGSMLGIIGHLTLFFYTNLLTTCIAAFGFFVYVGLYSLWKCRTIYGTAIGSIAGAVPPVVGYCAISDQLDAGALMFFIMLVLWQMPHFFAIGLYHLDDYQVAQIPMLPVLKGVKRTKIHMMIYIFLFLFTSGFLTFFGYTGYLYLVVTLSASSLWLWLCLQGFKSENTTLWGSQMLRMSLVVITLICVIIPFDVVK